MADARTGLWTLYVRHQIPQAHWRGTLDPGIEAGAQMLDAGAGLQFPDLSQTLDLGARLRTPGLKPQKEKQQRGLLDNRHISL